MSAPDVAPAEPSPSRADLLAQRLKERLARAAAPTIPRRPDDAGPAPLAPVQQAIWLADQIGRGASGGDHPAEYRIVALRLRGPLDREALEAALGGLVERHEPLRTTYPTQVGQPVQQVASAAGAPLRDVDSAGEAEPDAAIRAHAAAVQREPFDLAASEPLRADLLAFASDDHALVLRIHHVAFDGWSERVLVEDLRALYAAHATGAAASLAPLPVRYQDVAAWQRAQSGTPKRAAGRSFWKGALAGVPTRLDLPLDRPRSPEAQRTVGTVPVAIPPGLAAGLRRVAGEESATPFAVLLAAFQALLCRVTRQSDLVVGTPVAGRSHREMEPLVGCFINTVALRARVADDQPFRALVRQAHRTTLDALAHADVPFSEVVADADPERGPMHALYQAFFQLRNLPAPRREPAAGLVVEPVRVHPLTSPFDLDLELAAAGEGYEGTLRYPAALFDHRTAAQLAQSYVRLLEGAAAAPDTPVERLPLLAPDEAAAVGEALRPRSLPAPPVDGVHRLFERQAAAHPDRVAVVDGEDGVTYGALNRWANRIAHGLRSRGVGPDVCVGVAMEKSAALVAAVLGVLKAGGAYVPVDPAYPEARALAIAADADLRLLLTDGAAPEWSLSEVEALGLDEVAAGGGEADLAAERLGTDRLAYVLFTSGSTGRPKGVGVTHRNLLCGLPAWNETLRFVEGRAVLQMARPTFDVFSSDLLQALCGGLRLVLCPTPLLGDPAGLLALIDRTGADAGSFVPAVITALAVHAAQQGRRLPLAVVVVGADVWRTVDRDRIAAALPDDARLMNVYGVTEATVSSTMFEGPVPPLASGTVPIGRPIPNVPLYVLDRTGAPVPPGVPGELCVGGDTVARGYLGRPDLTAERFVPDPFADGPGARMYRTGDLVRLLPSGDLELLGRIDHQVKLRGLRVETGEVEARLLAHGSIVEAAVAVRRGALAAYVVLRPGEEMEASAVRAWTAQALPAYMVPGSVTVLGRLPLSANGKVDRAALPEPQTKRPRTQRPLTEAERGVAAVWADVLGVDEIGPDDTFFGLGGHSLLAMRAVSEIRRRTGRDLSVATHLGPRSLSDVARAAEASAGGSTGPESNAEEKAQLLAYGAGLQPTLPDASLVQLFEQQASARPDASAATDGERRMTYRELAGRSNAVAHRLVEAGVRAHDRVGVWGERSLDAIVAVLGALKAGATYVPLDPEQPARRHAFVLSDAGARVVLVPDGASEHPRGVLPDGVRVLDRIGAEPPVAEGPSLPGAPDAAAYVMYTSGSTGTPKGVVVTHRSVAALVLGAAYAPFGPDASTLHTAPLAFDASTFELWGPLLCGGRIVVSTERVPTPAALGALIRQERVSSVFVTTALFNVFAEEYPDALRGARTILTGGEAASVPHFRRALTVWPDARIVHCYGPTEVTTFATCYPVDAVPDGATTVPIGRPILHTDAYVLDEEGDLVPVGTTGELVLGGAGVAAGYLGREALTAERFGPDPFRPGGRVYRTGDLVRWVEDPAGGTPVIEFVGRKDDQVKIRGHRIEPGETAAALRALPGVADAAVVVQGEGAARYLAAFVTAEAGRSVEGAGLRSALRDTLPDYLVPQTLDVLARLPLTPNGKVDRAALVSRALDRPPSPSYDAPQTATEQALATAWADVLGVEDVGRQSRFPELGGHSLLALRALAQFTDATGLQADLASTLRGETLATISAAARPVGSQLERGVQVEGEDAPLTGAQRALWTFQHVNPGDPTYNMPFAFALEGGLDEDRLAAALSAVVARHEALRTRYPMRGGEPVQVPAAPEPVQIERIDLRGESAAVIEASRERVAARPFDLAWELPFRATLLQVGPDRYELVLNLHHISGDGWSWPVLLREVSAAYAGGPAAAALPVRMTDVARAEADWRAQPSWTADVERAAERLTPAPPVLALPADAPRRLRTRRPGRRRELPLAPGVLARAQALASEAGVSVSAVLLAAYELTLARSARQRRFALGTPVAMRSRPGTPELVGFLVHTAVVRADLTGQPSFRELARRAHSELVAAVADADVPLDALVEAARLRTSQQEVGPLRALFSVAMDPPFELELAGLRTHRVPLWHPTAKAEVSLHVQVTGEPSCRVVADADLFSGESVDAFLASFAAALQAGVESPNAPVALPVETGTAGPSATEPAGRGGMPGPPEEWRMASVWAKVLGREGFGRDDGFFDVGGDSLLALRLAAEIELVFGTPVPVSAVFAQPTIAELAALAVGGEGVRSSVATFAERGEGPRLLVTPDAWGLPAPLGSLIAPHLQNAGAVLGLRAPAVATELPDVRSLEALAAGLIEHVDGRLGAGPVHLFGMCYGGPLALETAVQLRARGVAVGRVIWVNQPDLPSYSGGQRYRSAMRTPADRLLRAVQNAARTALLRGWRSPLGPVLSRGRLESRRVRAAHWAYLRLNERYAGRPYPGRVDVVLTAAHAHEEVGPGIRSMAEEVVVHRIPGPHMPRSPEDVAVVAELIDALLGSG